MTPLLLTLALAQPPLPVYPPPIPVPVLPAEPPPRPMTLAEFGHCFVPTPGPHVFCLIHPATGKPVTVAFSLPDCYGPPTVKVSKREVEFRYPRHHEVELQFRHRGTVDVRTR